ncbi:hypothetical protein Tco_1346409 [Tanacetum coccineum]
MDRNVIPDPNTLGTITTSSLIDGAPYGGIYIFLKDLDLEQKRFTLMLLEHQDVISEFSSSSWWKELSKETGSKILLGRYGSREKMFKPIASLIANGKLKFKGAIREGTIRSKTISSSRWKELSKEIVSEILPSGDGSREKTFKPIASLILTTSPLIDGAPCGGIYMFIKDLDLEQNRFTLMLLEHQDVISEFSSSSWWKELSKETGSEILLSGDGFREKTFNPIASLIAKGKLKFEEAVRERTIRSKTIRWVENLFWEL